MVLQDSCLYPHCIWFSPMANLEGPNILPKGLIDTLTHSTPYHSKLYHSNIFSPYPSIPPHSTISCLPFPAGIHHALFLEGSPTFKCCPASIHPPAAWPQHCTHPPSVPAGFIAHLPQVNCPLPSHAPGLFTPSTMSSPRSRSHPHSTLGLGSA